MSVNRYDPTTDTLIPVSGTNSHLKDEMVAEYESTSTATHAYEVGDQFIYNGKLYEATSAISVGDTIITEGANANCIKSDSLTEQIARKGSGGHTILNESGTEMHQRSKLQFEGCEVTDDSTNDITKIKAEGGEVISYADYQQLTPQQQASGDYYIPDVPINSSILPMGGFDSTPTENSLNPVTSNGIYQAIEVVSDRVTTLEDTVGKTAIPSELGITVTGAIANLVNDLNGTILWEGDTNYQDDVYITLSQSYRNFKKLGIVMRLNFDLNTLNPAAIRPLYREVLCSDIDYIRNLKSTRTNVSTTWGYSGSTDYVDIVYKADMTDTYLCFSTNTSQGGQNSPTSVLKIIGFKYLI